MKLESYIISEAFYNKDWNTVIAALCSHFNISISQASPEISSDYDYKNEIILVRVNPNISYFWSEGVGFTTIDRGAAISWNEDDRLFITMRLP